MYMYMPHMYIYMYIYRQLPRSLPLTSKHPVMDIDSS